MTCSLVKKQVEHNLAVSSKHAEKSPSDQLRHTVKLLYFKSYKEIIDIKLQKLKR